MRHREWSGLANTVAHKLPGGHRGALRAVTWLVLFCYSCTDGMCLYSERHRGRVIWACSVVYFKSKILYQHKYEYPHGTESFHFISFASLFRVEYIKPWLVIVVMHCSPGVYAVQKISTCLVVLAAWFVKTSTEITYTECVSMQAFAPSVLVTYWSFGCWCIDLNLAKYWFPPGESVMKLVGLNWPNHKLEKN